MKGTKNKFGVSLLRSEGRKAFCMCKCGTEFETSCSNFHRTSGCAKCRYDAHLQRLREKYIPRERKDRPYRHLGVPPGEIRFQVSRRLKALGIEGDPNDYATSEQILAHVGDRPKSTNHRIAVLKIKTGLPPYAENFYWGWKITSEALDEILANDAKNRNRDYTATRVRVLEDDDIEKARKQGLRWKPKKNDYAQHIGRVFGSLKVVCVSAKECDGVITYMYTVKCTRCGAVYCKRAAYFIRGKFNQCRKCGYLCTGKNKNSAVVWDNRYGRYAPKWKTVVDPGITARILMNNYTGEYTVFHGTPGYMEARIDADLLGLRIGD
jgi:hypothetical protein